MLYICYLIFPTTLYGRYYYHPILQIRNQMFEEVRFLAQSSIVDADLNQAGLLRCVAPKILIFLGCRRVAKHLENIFIVIPYQLVFVVKFSCLRVHISGVSFCFSLPLVLTYIFMRG